MLKVQQFNFNKVVGIQFDAGEAEIGVFMERGNQGVALEMTNALARELLTALKALLEPK